MCRESLCVLPDSERYEKRACLPALTTILTIFLNRFFRGRLFGVEKALRGGFEVSRNRKNCRRKRPQKTANRRRSKNREIRLAAVFQKYFSALVWPQSTKLSLCF